MPRAALTVCRQLCAALLLLLPSLQGLAQEAVAPARVTWLVVVAVCVIGLIVATQEETTRRLTSKEHADPSKCGERVRRSSGDTPGRVDATGDCADSIEHHA